MKFLKLPAMVILMCSAMANAQHIPENYLMEAAGNNPGLKSKFSEFMAALEKVPQAGALPDPQITFGYFIQPVETRLGPQKLRISATQMFPWFGTLAARKDVASEMARSKFEIFEESKSRLFYDVKSSWYNLYFTRKAIQITHDNLDILNTLRKLSLVRVEAGLASTVDVLRVEIEIADLENQLAMLTDNLTAQRIAFNNLLNVDHQRSVDLPDSLTAVEPELTYEAMLDSIRNGNHQVLQLEFMEASYQSQEIAAKKSGNPAIGIGFDYIVVGESPTAMSGASEAGRDAVVFPMVGISVPLYRKKYVAMAREAVLMQESARLGKLDRINLLETTFERAHQDYRDADRRIVLYTEQTRRARQALDILQSAYETSGQDFEELLRIERLLLSYGLALEKAKTDESVAMAFINYLMGK